MIRRTFAPTVSLVTLVACGCAVPRPTAELAYFPDPPAHPRVVHLKSFRSLGELVPRQRSIVERIRGGITGSGVSAAAGIAYRNGHLYICDRATARVHDWDLASGRSSYILPPASIEFVKPVAVAADDDFVYVADSERGEVIRCSLRRTGAKSNADSRSSVPQLTTFRPTDRPDFRPVACAVHEDRLYVADVSLHVVDMFSLRDGRHVASLGGAGSQPGRFYYPCGVTVTHEGRIIVSDSFNARVQVFARTGEPTLSFGKPGNRYGDMGKPRHVAVGPDCVIFVADIEYGRVHMFDRMGRLLMLLGGSGDVPGTTPTPVGVAIAKNLPAAVRALVPPTFRADYFIFVSNSFAAKPISLFAVGERCGL